MTARSQGERKNQNKPNNSKQFEIDSAHCKYEAGPNLVNEIAPV